MMAIAWRTKIGVWLVLAGGCGLGEADRPGEGVGPMRLEWAVPARCCLGPKQLMTAEMLETHNSFATTPLKPASESDGER